MKRLEIKNCNTIYYYTLPSDQIQMIKQTKFMHSLLGRAFEIVKYSLWSRIKHIEARKVLKPDVQQLRIKDVITKGWLNEEAKEPGKQ